LFRADRDGLGQARQFGQLRSLKIGGASIDDASLPLLAKIATLTSLTIEDASITGEGLAALVALPLEDLSLARCFGITDEALADRPMSGLRQLYVRDILISGSGLGQLAPLARLSTLRLRQTGVATRRWGTLAKLPALRRLELVQSWITDEGLATIGEQTGLNHWMWRTIG
jgi:internalin A